MADHEHSAPPSPLPPPPDHEPLQRQHTGQHRAVTASEAGRITVLPPAELTRRTLRAERIAEENRMNLGRPESMGPDGTIVPATGFWKTMAPVVKMAEIFWKERETATKGKGWLGERLTKLLDALLPGVVIGVVAVLVAYFTGHWK